MISSAQKIARENFKKAIEYRKKTNCTLKQAFAHIKGKKAAPKKVGAIKKKAAPKKVAKKKAPKKLKYAGTLKKQDGKRMYKYSLGKKPTEKTILNKIHKVKKEVDNLDEAQHKHMSSVKSKKIGAWYDHKPYTLTQLKKIHKDFFRTGYESYFHVKKKKLIISKKLDSQVYLEKQMIPYLGVQFTARKVHADGSFGDTKRFSNISDLDKYIDKHITF